MYSTKKQPTVSATGPWIQGLTAWTRSLCLVLFLATSMLLAGTWSRTGTVEVVAGFMPAVLHAKTAGAVAGLAANHLSPTEPNHVFAWHLMANTYADPQDSLGEIFERALIATTQHGLADPEWTEHYLTLGDFYNLYGDPELPVVALPVTRAGNSRR